MINFASLFNQFRSGSNNAVNEILDQDNPTLSKLLDEESFINEFKSGNAKVLEFMKYNKIKQLVDYITLVGPPEDKKRSYKFPMNASDILSSDNNALIEYFLPQGKLYDEIRTQQEKQVQVQIEVEDTTQQSNSSEAKTQTQQADKQKTIINDTLQQGDEQNAKKQKQQPVVTEADKNQNKETQKQQKTKQTKKIKIKKIEKVEKIEKIQVQPLINYLFKYFQTPVNYILTGYVCKTLTVLLNKKGNQLMDFLFRNNNVQKMINHIESRSVGQFLLKVLTFQSNRLADERTIFFKKLLQQLGENNQIHVLSNFSAFISQTIQKAAANVKGTSSVSQFSNIFFTPQIVTIVIRNVMSDFQNVCVYNAPILLTYLTNVPFTLPKDETIISQFKTLLQIFVQKSLQKLTITNKQRRTLGVGRVKIIQILTYILKQNLLDSRQIFANQQTGFKTLFNLCKNYQLNNVLHNQVVKIISISFSDQNTLSHALTRNDVLLNFIVEEADEDVSIKSGKGSQRFRKGFIGHIVQICRLIQQYASKGNISALSIEQKPQFANVLTILVQKQIYQINKSLAGFSLKRQAKSQIMFSKEDIVSHFYDFLSQSPKPVFQAEPQPINIQHPDFLQQMQRQIQQNLSQQKKQQNSGSQQGQSDTHSTVSIQVHFFKGHLDYDLDELMEDL